MLPLEGITVVSVEQAIAAPFATRQLAELGARVIKTERPGGGDFARRYDTTVRGMSSHFVWVNRSKESMTLNVKSSEGREILRKLLKVADVFVYNLAPGSIEEMGLAPPALREAFPKLITCAVTGYGTGSASAERKAYDLLIQAETGLLSITGTEGEPAKAGIPVADIAAGSYAYSSILAALLQRERTGKGQSIEISLFDALTEFMGFPIYYTRYGGRALTRSGAHHAAISPYGPFACANGHDVVIAIQNDAEWVAFVRQVLEQPDLLADPRFATNTDRTANRTELHALIENSLRRLSLDELIRRLDCARIAHAQNRGIDEFVVHRDLKDRARWISVESPVGPLDLLRPPAIFDGFDYRMDPIPAVGEHTEKILQELGYSPDDIENMKSKSVV